MVWSKRGGKALKVRQVIAEWPEREKGEGAAYGGVRGDDMWSYRGGKTPQVTAGHGGGV